MATNGDQNGLKLPSKDFKASGRYVRLTALHMEDADVLMPTILSPEVINASWWQYLLPQPITTLEALRGIIQLRIDREGEPYAIVDLETGKVIGWISLHNLVLDASKTEIGIFLPSPVMQRTPRATEAVFLLLQYAFEVLHFLVVLWKSHPKHQASAKAAIRLGFQSTMSYKPEYGEIQSSSDGENRLLFVINLERWRAVKGCYEKWLDPSNFDTSGIQINKLQIAPR